MAKRPQQEIDLQSDAWQRFERAVDVVAKSPPQPNKKKAAAGKQKSKPHAKKSS